MLKKYGIHLTLIVACALIILLPMLKDEPDPKKIEQATVAAMDFLKVVDAGDYETARKEGASLLKQNAPLNEWVNKLTGDRKFLGAVKDRQQVEVSYSTTALDSPDGEYVMLTFNSQFDNRKDLKETVVVMLDGERGWRVAGYHYR